MPFKMPDLLSCAAQAVSGIPGCLRISLEGAQEEPSEHPMEDPEAADRQPSKRIYFFLFPSAPHLSGYSCSQVFMHCHSTAYFSSLGCFLSLFQTLLSS